MFGVILLQLDLEIATEKRFLSKEIDKEHDRKVAISTKKFATFKPFFRSDFFRFLQISMFF